MSSEQWKTGLITLVNASQTVIGTASCDWLNQLEAGHVLKQNADGEATYTIATILTATRLILSAKYSGTGGTGLGYMACRSFTTNRGYWRPLQGDSDWAEVMSQETLDKIDTDMSNALSGYRGNWVEVDAATYAASIGNLLAVDSKTYLPVISAPSNPEDSGDFFEIRDAYGHFNASPVTILPNGNNINSQNASLVLDMSWKKYRLTYINATIGYHIE